MANWERILDAAEQLARQLRGRDIDYNEAKKALDFYLANGCDDRVMQDYLNLMATQPPARSKQTRRYYQALRDVWSQWQPGLQGIDKARAAGWALRMATEKRGG